MKTSNFKQAPSFSTSPNVAFKAWLDSKQHGAMIGSSALIDPKVGGKFSIWDDYATGETLEIDPIKHRIIQTWRDNSTDWPEGYYSKITLEFVQDKSKPGQTRLRFWHSGVPAEHAKDIAKGWKDFYWQPMQDYFAAK